MREIIELQERYEKSTRRLMLAVIVVMGLMVIGMAVLGILTYRMAEEAKAQSEINTFLIARGNRALVAEKTAAETVGELAEDQAESLEEHRRRSEINFDQLFAGIRCLAKTHYRTYRAFEKCVEGVDFETDPRPRSSPRPSPTPKPSPSKEPEPSPQPDPPPSPSPTCRELVAGFCRP